jgi:cytochrome d ubiquinol oxidase subunit I
MFVLAVSSYYLLKGRDIEFAKRSFRIAAAFGFASACSVIVLGDESGYTVSEAQKTKLAAMEAMWETEKAPAGLTLIAGINEKEMKNDWEIKIPWVMGLIGTRSVDKQLPGIKELRETNRKRIISGIEAVKALEAIRKDKTNETAKATLKAHVKDLGFGLLLKKYVKTMDEVTPEIIEKAVADTIPAVTPMFWTFRIMVALGFAFFALFGLALWYSIKDTFHEKKWLLRWALWFLPTPWIACELGWFVAEYGRQPWTIYGILPTHHSVSTLTTTSLYGSLAGFVGFYTILLCAEMYLMFKFGRQGPGSLGTGRYANEPAHA